MKSIAVWVCACLAAFAVVAAPARAAGVSWPPPELTRIPAPVGGESLSGSRAGQLDGPRGIAADSTTGHIFVADQGNARIDEFTAWGEFVEAWGWGVAGGAGLETCGPGATPPTADCAAGLSNGAGPGQLSSLASGISLDAEGDVFVSEDACEAGPVCAVQNYRVQKFAPDGSFLLMFGGQVNKTKVAEREQQEAASEPVTVTEAEENLCTAASGDECGIGRPGTGDGEFSAHPGGTWGGTLIAISDGTVYVADRDRIEEFSTGGVYEGEIGLPTEGEVEGGTPGGQGEPQAIAVDAAGSVYFAFWQGALEEDPPTRPFVFKHTPAGWSTFANVGFPTALGVDSAGDVLVSWQPLFELEANPPRVLAFAPNGSCLPGGCVADDFGDDGSNIYGLATNAGCSLASEDLLVTRQARGESYVQVFGPPPDTTVCPPPAVPPTITEQYAVAVGTDNATLQAKVNPHFWTDARYFVQYGVGKCSEGHCEEEALAPGKLLGGGAVGLALATANVPLTGLEPGKTYHYRFVAQSSGGGPVFGVGETGAEGTFRTFAEPAPSSGAGCPNQALRTGDSALLEDCRAYEMVSPVEKEGGNIVALGNLNSYPAALDQSAASGEAITYSSYSAFGDALSSPFTSQYLARREAGREWVTEPISPARGGTVLSRSGELDTQYKAFSPELDQAWLLYDSTPPLDPTCGAEGYANLDQRLADGAYRGLICATPSHHTPLEFVPELQGASSDGSRTVFWVRESLAEGAPVPGAGEGVVYEAVDGILRNVCVLPDGSATARCSTGMGGGNVEDTRTASVNHAVSSDGARIYWTASNGVNGGGPGTIYLRVNADEPQSAISAGKCVEPTKACTLPVSEKVSTAAATFSLASADGARAIFTVGEKPGEEKLYDYELSKQSATLIARGVYGVVGGSEDARTLYFVSQEALTGAEENSAGSSAEAGKPNLYRYKAGGTGAFAFVATLSTRDASQAIPSPVNVKPKLHLARVTATGQDMLFMSSASLTGVDNRDLKSGKADAEVYRYDASEKALECMSCDPSRARPVGQDIGIAGTEYWVAAQIPAWESQLYSSRVLSANGGRAFFDSFQPLVPGDTNSEQDIYEWEAVGEGTCTETGSSFDPQAGGCVSLISSGKSTSPSTFVDASPGGGDVFFTTEQSLLPQDPGEVDLYDAREGGGLPMPPTAAQECEGEACQSVAAPPAQSSPSSSTYLGPGNERVVVGPGNERVVACPKGKHRVRPKGKHRVRPKGKHRVRPKGKHRVRKAGHSVCAARRHSAKKHHRHAGRWHRRHSSRKGHRKGAHR